LICQRVKANAGDVVAILMLTQWQQTALGTDILIGGFVCFRMKRERMKLRC
jgi:hypothetical protein